jgi:hypothetical protein
MKADILILKGILMILTVLFRSGPYDRFLSKTFSDYEIECLNWVDTEKSSRRKRKGV